MIAARVGRALRYGLLTAAATIIIAGVAGDIRHQAALAHMTPAKMLAEGFAGTAIGFTIFFFVVFSVFPPRNRPPRFTPPPARPWESTWQQGPPRPPDKRERPRGRRGSSTR